MQNQLFTKIVEEAREKRRGAHMGSVGSYSHKSSGNGGRGRSPSVTSPARSGTSYCSIRAARNGSCGGTRARIFSSVSISRWGMNLLGVWLRTTREKQISHETCLQSLPKTRKSKSRMESTFTVHYYLRCLCFEGSYNNNVLNVTPVQLTRRFDLTRGATIEASDVNLLNFMGFIRGKPYERSCTLLQSPAARIDNTYPE
jgi:hypothetical protein